MYMCKSLAQSRHMKANGHELNDLTITPHATIINVGIWSNWQLFEGILESY